MTTDDFQYDAAGVDPRRAGAGLARMAESIRSTFALRDDRGFGKPLLDLGFYANVLALPGGQGLAIATDGVGTKLIVAELAGRYDTIGIDLVAMNVNDIICVGAEPFAMVDYVAVGAVDEEMFAEIGQGLLEACRQSRITIPGGEIAQVRELIKGHGDCDGLDLVGTAVGLVETEKMILGRDIVEGDIVVGLGANGLHSNGYTLARRVLLDDGGLALGDRPGDLPHSLADELLRPTKLYVASVMALLAAKLPIRGLAHITGDGFCNLERLSPKLGFVLDDLPAPDAIYRLIQQTGEIGDAEMFSVFNMGVGFCIVCPPETADDVVATCHAHGETARVVGRVTSDHPGEVRLPGPGLRGRGGRFRNEA